MIIKLMLIMGSSNVCLVIVSTERAAVNLRFREQRYMKYKSKKKDIRNISQRIKIYKILFKGQIYTKCKSMDKDIQN